MVRTQLRNSIYFGNIVDFYMRVIPKRFEGIGELDDQGKVGCIYDIWDYSFRLLVSRYSRGDAIADLRDSVLQMIELLALKRSTLAGVHLDKDVRQMYERLDLSKLYESLGLLAFMVSLRFPVAEIQHVLELIGHPGEDMMLDHVAHVFGDASRKIAPQSKFPKVYEGLTDVIASPPEQRPAKLKKFVESWYKKMKPISWHNNHQGAEGAYFGYWCFEAALIAMLFNIDDTAVLDHPNYPGDLTRYFHAGNG